MELKIKKEVLVKAKTIELFVKACDQGSYTLKDQDGEVITEKDEDYVPSFFPEEHYGDYIDLKIDIETGRIINWKKPDVKEIEEWIKKDDE